MKFKDWTVLLVPDHASQVRRFRLSRQMIICLVIIQGLLLTMLGIFGGGYFYRIRQGRILEKYKIENQDLKVQFQALSQQMNAIQNQLTRVNELDHKIRMVVGLERKSEVIMGTGGPEAEQPAMSMLLPSEEADQVKRVASKLNQIDLSLDAQETSMEELNSYLKENQSLLLATPSIWPVRGWVTSEFGVRMSPLDGNYGVHQGIDIASPQGTLIRSSANGTVSFARWAQGYGNLVVITHGYGLSTKYGHCSEVLVREGQSVKRGQVIATIGSTGRASGPHLHYEVLVYGVPVNPRKYLLQ